MTPSTLSHTMNSSEPDPRWKDMYRVGTISSTLLLASV
jgi:hypothetical protein